MYDLDLKTSSYEMAPDDEMGIELPNELG